jgi:hypothetical protein
MGFKLKKRLMLVLAMDVKEEGSKLRQLVAGYRNILYVCRVSAIFFRDRLRRDSPSSVVISCSRARLRV